MRLALAAALLLAAPVPALAQDDAAQVIAVTNRLFEGMRTKDSALIRSLFVPGARLVGAGMRDGKPTLRLTSVDEFITANATSPVVWNEVMPDPEVRLDGTLATVWGYYEFRAGDRFSHCGVDAIQLVRTAEGWKMASLADTQRREGCRGQPR